MSLAALLLAAAPEIVALHIEAPPAVAQRLSRYVDLAPGRPGGPDALRRAVEVLHATGEVADVLVETSREGDGIEVTLHPVPAPRLRGVSVRGDGVVSLKVLTRAAHIRHREALWPDRLETIGRDGALELARRGWLEARVGATIEPEPDPFLGCRLVLDVHSGPRARVAATQIEGIEPADTELRGAVRPRLREPFERAKADKAAQDMRLLLVQRGFWSATVDIQESYDPRYATVGLLFSVAPGPPTKLAFRGSEIPGALQRETTQIVRDGRSRPDALEEAVERIEASLRRAGHRQALVRRHEEVSPDGRTFVLDVAAGPITTADSVVVRGISTPSAALATRVGEPVQDTTLDADRNAIRRELEARGNVDPSVDVDLSDAGGALPVVFRVRPGPEVRVAAVGVEPSTPPDSMATQLKLIVGEPYRARDIAADRAALVALWRNAGYLAADVQPEVSMDASGRQATVRYVVNSGRRTMVDRVVVAGLGVTREKVVLRELQVEQGQPLRAGALVDSQRRLATLAAFSQASLTEVSDGGERSTVLVSLEEGPRTTFGYGLGYSERELLRGSFEVSRRNLFGLDRSLSLYARGSFRGNRFLATYREPWFFGQKREVFLTAFHEEEKRDAFDFRRNGGLLQTGRSLGGRVNLILRWLYQQTNIYNLEIPIDEIDREFRDYAVSGPSASILRDTRDDPLEPTRGTFLGADGQLSLRPLGGASYAKGFLQATVLERIGPRTLFVASARLGLARTFGPEPPLLIPLPERFFAGGDYGPRGFRTDGVGPVLLAQNDAVTPTGGNALVLGGAELRFDASRFLSLATFTDTGNVYPLVADISLGDLRWSAGVGVRYKTALGPIRVDWGYKLNRRPGESASRFHFTIGHAF